MTYGDYLTGANHVLPTGALARSYSGLSVLDFMRWTTVQLVDRYAAARLAEDVGLFATAEGLQAHAAAGILAVLVGIVGGSGAGLGRTGAGGLPPGIAASTGGTRYTSKTLKSSRTS